MGNFSFSPPETFTVDRLQTLANFSSFVCCPFVALGNFRKHFLALYSVVWFEVSGDHFMFVGRVN